MQKSADFLDENGKKKGKNHWRNWSVWKKENRKEKKKKKRSPLMALTRSVIWLSEIIITCKLQSHSVSTKKYAYQALCLNLQMECFEMTSRPPYWSSVPKQ